MAGAIAVDPPPKTGLEERAGFEATRLFLEPRATARGPDREVLDALASLSGRTLAEQVVSMVLEVGGGKGTGHCPRSRPGPSGGAGLLVVDGAQR